MRTPSIALLLSLLTPAVAHGQVFAPGSFSDPITLASAGSDRARLMVDGDFDGDGVTDLVVASLGDLRLTLYRGLGGGMVVPARILAEGYQVTQLRPGDVDADGDLDLVIAAWQTPPGGSVAPGPLWIENLGGGTFVASPVAFGGPDFVPTAINIGDLDGDGDLDAATVDFATGEIRWYTFTGTGFSGPTAVGTAFAYGPTDVTITDLDGDGAQDIVVAYDDEINRFSRPYWYRNTGGAFAAGAAVGGIVERALSIRAIDADLDGEVDLIAGTMTGAAIYRNLGQGTFASFPGEFHLGRATSSIELADVDGDGILDLVGGSTTGFPAHWAPGTGGLNFGSAVQVGPFQAVGSWTDLDGDGDTDWVYGRRLATGLEWLSNDGAGGFGASVPLDELRLDRPSEVLFADLDQDGDADLLAAASGNGAVEWFENVGGVLAAPKTVGVLAGVRRLAVGDMDLDGDLDVLAAGVEGAWFEQGPSGFVPTPVMLGSALDLALADLDGDGLEDLLYRRAAGIVRRPGIGLGAFGVDDWLSTDFTSSPSDVLARDLDGDGDLDILAGGNSVRRVLRIENLGAGVFAAAEAFSVPFSSTPVMRVAAEDVNADGHIDLLAGGTSFYWLPGLGGGAYGAAVFFGSSSSSAEGGFATSDIDGDGDLDFAYASSSNEPLVHWRALEANGAVGGARLVSDSQMIPVALAMADIDGDGDPDLAVASGDDQTIALYLNHVPNIHRYCAPAVVNQTGDFGHLFALGSPSTLPGGLRLRATRLPSQSSGYFITSRVAGFVASPGGSVGNLCLSGAIGRYVGPGQVLNTGPFGGTFELALDPTRMPGPTGFVPATVGETWRFQAWYRDSLMGAPTSNFTDALAIRFE